MEFRRSGVAPRSAKPIGVFIGRRWRDLVRPRGETDGETPADRSDRRGPDVTWEIEKGQIGSPPLWLPPALALRDLGEVAACPAT